MFCIRVQEGRERIEVRYYQNGFLPSYRPVNASGKETGRRLVVPGYIFMLKPVPRAEKVPEEEWLVIEAVSDPRISVMDFAAGEITEGPLKAAGKYITDVSPNRVKVSASLFGEKRDFWLPVRNAEEIREEKEETAAEPDGTARGEKDPENGMNPEEENAMAEKMEFTEEQKMMMAARAEEIGVHAAAAELNVPWQTLGKIRREAAKKEMPGIGAAPPDDPEALRRENVLLRKRVAELEKKITAFRNAFRDLTEK